MGKTVLQVRQVDNTCENCVASQNPGMHRLCEQCEVTGWEYNEGVMYLDYPKFVDKAIGLLTTLIDLYPQKTMENVLVQLKTIKEELGDGN